MTLETISTFIQMVANIAVIVSLVFVALQVRMGVKMLRDAAMRNHNEKHQSVSRAVFENPQLAELWIRGSKNGLADLSDAERAQFVNFYMYVLRVLGGALLTAPLGRDGRRALCSERADFARYIPNARGARGLATAPPPVHT